MSKEKHISVGYDNTHEQGQRIRVRRAIMASGAVAITAGSLIAGLNHEGNAHDGHSGESTHIKHIDNTNGGKDYIPMVSIKVREGENPSVLANELAVSPDMGARMIEEIKAQEQTPNILPAGQVVRVEAGIIDPQALADRRAENSAH